MRKRPLFDIWKTVLSTALFLHAIRLFGQTPEYPNDLDIGIRFISPVPSPITINGVFGVSAEIYLEANSSIIPEGEQVKAKITLTDPSGVVIDSYAQVWDGFEPGEDGVIEENYLGDAPVNNDVVLFNIPWSQIDKWSAGANWTVSLRVEAPSVETNMTNNFASQSLQVIVPDLVLSQSSLFLDAVNPITGNYENSYIPNTNFRIRGIVENQSDARTQAYVHAAVVAQLRKRSGSYIGEVLDEQIVLLGDSDSSGVIGPNGSRSFTIDELMMPEDAEGEYTVTVRVNPQDVPGGPVMKEQSFANNDGNVSFVVESGDDQQNQSGLARLVYVENSYSGEKGSFRGLDPTFVSFALRNVGTAPVSADDEISAKLVLSKDLDVDLEDFVIREFNLGGGGIGEGLVSGETVNLTWFQQLPDNLEGDYYLLVEIDNGGLEGPLTTAIDSTPSITLLSQDKGTTDLLVANPVRRSERPSISTDGRFIVYESPNADGIMQIYLIDRQQPNSEPILISKSYLSTDSNEIEGNLDSFRPQISSDGRKIVFHSKAHNLVIGDTNLKDDVFLYDTVLNTMLRPLNADGEQLNGRSLYPDINEDGTKIVFESDSNNVRQGVEGPQIYYWSVVTDSSSTGVSSEVYPLTNGDQGSYSPSIDNSGNFVVFDSYASNLLGSSNSLTGTGGRFANTTDLNNLRDIFLVDIEENETYLASYNYFGQQTEYSFTRPDPGHSQNAKISGDGTRIVFESTADNLHQGGGIATVVVTTGGAGYQGKPIIEIADTNVNPSGRLGSGAVLALREDGINSLQEIKSDGIMVIDAGINYVDPLVTIHPDPDYPEPTVSAEAVAYLSNPEGDIYSIDVSDIKGAVEIEGSKRLSENITGTGGNFGSRDIDINDAGDIVVFSTKSSNLLEPVIEREDGKKFYNSNYILPKANVLLVGGIGEVEIKSNGYGYSSGNLRITDLSGTGKDAIASYEVDNRGRVVEINIVDPGYNYNLETTYVSIEEPRGGEGFEAGQIRFVPTVGEGVTRSGGAKIYKVEMTEYGYGYKIGETEDLRFDDIFSFEGDGADLNEDGFPDGRINPDRVYMEDGSIYLEQKFSINVLERVPELLDATILEVYDRDNPISPIRITFDSQISGVQGNVVGINGLNQSEIRDKLIEALVGALDINSSSSSVLNGPVVDQNQSNGTSFVFSALSGRFSTNNPQAIMVEEHSNMLIHGSGYTRATPVINQVPNIYGYSEIDGYPQVSPVAGVGRSTLLAQPDIYSDDIYLYDFNSSENRRISTSTFGTPAGYLQNPIPAPPSSRFPAISGNGRFVVFSSDVYGIGGLVFDGSNQNPLLGSQNVSRNLYLRDLKTFTVTPPSNELNLDLLIPNKSKVFEFAPQTLIPIFASFSYNGDFNMSVYLNRKRLTNDQITLERFGGHIQEDINPTALLDTSILC